MKNDFKDGTLIFYLEGKIDSSNADRFEAELMDENILFDTVDVAFDAEKLDYISSAGLRVLLKVKKTAKNTIRILNVSDEIFDIFDVTGFSDFFEIERKMRQISLKGCSKISSALNGEIYRLSEDEMVKVFGNSVPMSDIKKERSYAQTALAFDIPTLIPYDIVQCELGYGIVYEIAEMTSLSYLLSREPQKCRQYAAMLAVMMSELHSTEIPKGKLPDIKDRYREWINDIDDPNDSKINVFSNLISSIQDSPTYVHGDINLNSVLVKGRDLLLLDMAGSGRGHAIFDLQALFASCVAIEKKKPGYCQNTYGLSGDICVEFWTAFFDTYMGHRKAQIDSMNELLLKYFVLKESVLTKLEEKHRLSSR